MGAKVLVLGGGGIAGLAWFAGLLYGLFESGIDLRDAERVLGTSAGSVTVAQLRSAQSIEMLYARQTDPALIVYEPLPTAEQFAALIAAFAKTWRLTTATSGCRPWVYLPGPPKLLARASA